MLIKTKFNINDKVFHILLKNIHTEVLCTLCSGAGFININKNYTKICPSCIGYKSSKIQYGEAWDVVNKEKKIIGIQIEISSNYPNGLVFYILEGNIKCSEIYVFPNIEEAFNDCYRLNIKEGKNNEL